MVTNLNNVNETLHRSLELEKYNLVLYGSKSHHPSHILLQFFTAIMHFQWQGLNTAVTRPVDRLWRLIAQRMLLRQCYISNIEKCYNFVFLLAHSKNELMQWCGVRRLSVCKPLRESLLLADTWTPSQRASRVCSRSRSRSKVTRYGHFYAGTNNYLTNLILIPITFSALSYRRHL